MFLVLEVLLQNSVLLLVQEQLFLQYLWFQFPVLECFLFLEKVLFVLESQALPLFLRFPEFFLFPGNPNRQNRIRSSQRFPFRRCLHLFRKKKRFGQSSSHQDRIRSNQRPGFLPESLRLKFPVHSEKFPANLEPNYQTARQTKDPR